MNPVLLAQLINTVGTVGLPLVQKLLADIEAGRTQTTVTAADLAELQRLAQQTSAEIIRRAGVVLPGGQQP